MNSKNILLNEGRTIKTAKDAIDLLNSGKLAGRLGGKKFIPNWVLEDQSSFSQLLYLTLKLFDDDPSTASDETIQFMIKVSQESAEKWLSVLENNTDTLIMLSKAFAAQWFIKSPEFQAQLQKLTVAPYNSEDWHNLEKDIQNVFDKRAAKKGKKVSNTNNLYETLYDDGTWKLCVPKSFEGDIELASHIKPFNSSKNTYTKARWCTAAQQLYYDKYTNDNTNNLWVIQYFVNGEYTEGWQLAQSTITHIEFMDKEDEPNYSFVLENAPIELLKRIICDNKDYENTFFGVSLWEILNAYYTNISKELENIDILFSKKNTYAMVQALNLFDESGFMINRSNILVACKARDAEFINVPDYIDYIRSGVFENFKNLESVDLSNTKIKTIQPITFKDCDNLVEVMLPETLIEIKSQAFQNCQKLSKINLSENIKLAKNVFVNCPNLKYGEETILNIKHIHSGYFNNFRTTHVKIGNDVVSIGDNAFSAESLLTKVDFSEAKKLKYIGKSSFMDCTNITKLNLTYVTSLSLISRNAFNGCTYLKEINLPSSLETIQDQAFEGCESLQSLDLSNLSIDSLPEKCFSHCKSLKEIRLPESLRKIGIKTFSNNEQLQSIILPSGLLSIGSYAFSKCINLKKIQIPTSVTYIGNGAFKDCENLSKIVFYGPDLDYFDPKEDIEWGEDYLSKIPTNIKETKKYRSRKILRDAFNQGYKEGLEKDEECLGGDFAKMSPTKTVILQRQPYYKRLNKNQTKKYRHKKLNENPQAIEQIQKQNIKKLVRSLELEESIEDRAYRVAKRKHDDTGALRRYSGEPYIVHPVGVAKIAKAFGGDDIEIAAAYLHDTVEDTGATIDDIEEKFGPNVAEIVSEVTTDPYERRRLGKEEYINRELQTISDNALFVKLCDMYYNYTDNADQNQKDRIIRNVSTLLNSYRGNQIDDRCLDLIDAILEAA